MLLSKEGGKGQVGAGRWGTGCGAAWHRRVGREAGGHKPTGRRTTWGRHCGRLGKAAGHRARAGGRFVKGEGRHKARQAAKPGERINGWQA